MNYLFRLGLGQGVVPPHERPNIQILRRLGFSGSDVQILGKAWKCDPRLVAACYSASSMWVANAATVTPSSDSSDGKVHFTPANLLTHFHRSIESEATSRILRHVFPDDALFVHHPALPGTPLFSDEGAANHTRFCQNHGKPGIHLFVFSRHGKAPKDRRQTYEASAAIARLHSLPVSSTIFAMQHPLAVESGIFHNDVIAVGNQQFLLLHELAYAHRRRVLHELHDKFRLLGGGDMTVVKVPERRLPLSDAVRTYFFNSQIVTLPNGDMEMVAAAECNEHPAARTTINWIIESAKYPLRRVSFWNLRQSMRNGGGPACLRLRVILTDKELQQVKPHVLFSDDLYQRLKTWINKYYRDKLSPNDLRDPSLLNESRNALDELTRILAIKSAYEFQA